MVSTAWFKVIFLLQVTYNVLALECFVCHSKQDPTCGDPFANEPLTRRKANNLKNATRTPVDCERVRQVGAGTVAASQALGGGFLPYVPLEPAPHVCFKLTMGNSYAVRGCSKPDFCQNITESCDTCNGDGCNSARALSHASYLLATSIALRYMSD